MLALGSVACREACRWVLENTATRTVVDPFCGVGTVLAVANELGMDAVGVELNKKRARKARSLTLDSGDRPICWFSCPFFPIRPGAGRLRQGYGRAVIGRVNTKTQFERRMIFERPMIQNRREERCPQSCAR
jgi:hypothetical protein